MEADARCRPTGGVLHASCGRVLKCAVAQDKAQDWARSAITDPYTQCHRIWRTPSSFSCSCRKEADECAWQFGCSGPVWPPMLRAPSASVSFVYHQVLKFLIRRGVGTCVVGSDLVWGRATLEHMFPTRIADSARGCRHIAR